MSIARVAFAGYCSLAVLAVGAACAAEAPLQTGSLGGSYASTLLDDITELFRRGARAAKDAARPPDAARVPAPGFEQRREAGAEVEVPRLGVIVVAAGRPARFEGSGTPGSRILLASGSRVLGRALVDDAGRWQITVEQGLGLGDIRLALSARLDESGRPVSGDTVRLHLPAEFARPVRITQVSERAPSEAAKETRPEAAASSQARRKAEDLASEASEEFSEIMNKTTSRDVWLREAAGSWSRVQSWAQRVSDDYQQLIVTPLSAPTIADGVTRTSEGPVRTAEDAERSRPGNGEAPLFSPKIYEDAALAADKVRDWLVRANREYQHEVARRLAGSTAGVEPTSRADAIAKRRAEIRDRFGDLSGASDADGRTVVAQQQDGVKPPGAVPPPPIRAPRQPSSAPQKDPRIEAAEKEAAEVARQAVEALRAEEKRKADEAARKAEEDARKLSEAERKAEERRQAELKQVEEARKAAAAAVEKRNAEEAARKAEERRLAELKQIEEARKAAAAAVEKRNAEEAARKAEEDARKLAEAERKAEERRQAELKQIEEARKGAVAVEQRRRAEEAARKAEDDTRKRSEALLKAKERQLAELKQIEEARQAAAEKQRMAEEARRLSDQKAARQRAAEQRVADRQAAADRQASKVARADAGPAAKSTRALRRKAARAAASGRKVSYPRSARKAADRAGRSAKTVKKSQHRKKFARKKRGRVAAWRSICGWREAPRRKSRRRVRVAKPYAWFWGISERSCRSSRRYPTVYLVDRRRMAWPDAIRPCPRLDIPA